MIKLVRILWIEEETNNAVAERRSFIQQSWRYHINIVESFIEGSLALDNIDDYDVVIMDIRLPEGSINGDPIDTAAHAHKNRYGLDLIKHHYKLQGNSYQRLMIFTNESWEDIVNEFAPLPAPERNRFMQKRECRSGSHFEEFIIDIYQRSLQ